MSVINWDSLKTSSDWSAALATLTQEADQAKTGTPADRQGVEKNLEKFWTIPCPFTTMMADARRMYDDLVLIDLGQLIDKMSSSPPQTLAASALPLPASGGASQEEMGKHVLHSLTTLQQHHRQHLASHLAILRQLDELKDTVQQLFLGKQPAAEAPPAPKKKAKSARPTPKPPRTGTGG